ncbi:GTPase IMAP family member 8-like isoform X2 [Archocentrus centrarchus]|uniref:GTPase IMAP family member 8-like isoform X2 n=1 Tax=Archocentrus centrarchus TaxID=63155 RepID=UPI0011E9DE6A|nr:GTPase IMAP family member 8-like isoform X2 [Archocentrus centrarchus]XP_030592074.1 GTPase IMAP family member 8-like isoform X2 [Archocentrus centrarchus]
MAAEHAFSNSGHSHHSSELRIVLIGGRELTGQPSNKSLSGNIILGKNVFDTSRRTAQSVVGQQEVHGRRVTVVDTPGWWWHYPLENTPKLDQIEIQNSVHLCPPGPHAFLLVIHESFYLPQIFISSLKEHLKLFHKDVLNHTIVLFTVQHPWHEENVETEMSEWSDMQWILEQCGNRKHVLSMRNRQDGTQVEKLFEKIEAMVAANGGRHCPIDSAHGNALREEMKAIAEGASKRFDEVQTQRRKLRALIEGGKTPPAHLRLVMVGAQWSAKSSAGNTILRKKAFAVDHGRTTMSCEISHGIVADRTLTVVDSPGWFYNHTLQDTSETDKHEIENSVHLCPPGPHAVLLMIGLASAFNTSYLRAVKEHMSLFRDDVWKHTIVLFTRGDWLGVKTVEERIESEEGLQWLVKKCGNRCHVLDNMKHSDEMQVQDLLEKIEETWVGNKDPHYEVDLDRGAQLEATKEAGEKLAKRIRKTTERQSRILRKIFEGEEQPITDLRIVLLGREESGKSMAGNKIFFEEIFERAWLKKEFQNQRRTRKCVKHEGTIGGINIAVIETPGWPAAMTPPSWLKEEVLGSVSMCAPGPHVFLLVVPIPKAFTEEDHKTVAELLMPFGERVWRHCMVLFTWGDWLNNRLIEEHIAAEGKSLLQLVEKCGYRYQVLNCHSFGNRFPVKELFQKITDMITQNKGQSFTAEGKQRKNQSVLTEEEWNRREQELIDRMLRAVVNEPEEPTLPSVLGASSFDGAFLPSMSGDAPSEFENMSERWSQRARAKVSEWLKTRAGNSDVTSGIGSMSASASHVEKLDESPLPDEND